MKNTDSNTSVFFELLQAGLWGKEVRLLDFGVIDFEKVFFLAEGQSVVGLIAAGLEHVVDVKVPKEFALTFVGSALQFEQRNISMNSFIEIMIGKLREAGIRPLLMKGQGIAQCYERPLWRAAGDVDFLLSGKGYEDAETYLNRIADSVQEENPYTRHKAMSIKSWDVEIHGTLRGGLGRRIDRELDVIQREVFEKNRIRIWKNGETDVFLLAADEDVIYVFTHILQHFFMGGIGLRQVCDWCRLIWTYRADLNKGLLESRISRMGLMSEWKAFAAMAVNKLGMPEDAMPLYASSRKWRRKSERIKSIILETGNFGHNRDVSYYQKYPFLVYKTISLMKNTRDSIRHFMIFPIDATRVWFIRLRAGIREVLKRK